MLRRDAENFGIYEGDSMLWETAVSRKTVIMSKRRLWSPDLEQNLSVTFVIRIEESKIGSKNNCFR